MATIRLGLVSSVIGVVSVGIRVSNDSNKSNALNNSNGSLLTSKSGCEILPEDSVDHMIGEKR